MPLNVILAEVAADIGAPIANDAEYQWLLGKINSAAKDLYEQNDLHGCLREQIIELDTTSQQISLPYYVFDLRGIRDYDSRLAIKMTDMRPRYQTEGWTDILKGTIFIPWRIKQQGSPVKCSWLMDGPLTFTLAKAASQAFNIVVIGATNTATRVQEVVTVNEGDTEVTTTNVFISNQIEAIIKSIQTAEDITVTSTDDVTIAEIPNCELSPSYTIVQVLDRGMTKGGTQLVEILYKIRFTPFVNEYDVFPCGEIYNEAIYWNTLSQIWAQREGDQWVNKAIAANAKALDAIKKITENKESGKTYRMDFGENRWMRLATQVLPERSHILRKPYG